MNQDQIKTELTEKIPYKFDWTFLGQMLAPPALLGLLLVFAVCC